MFSNTFIVLFLLFTAKIFCSSTYPGSVQQWKTIEHKKCHVNAVSQELALFDAGKVSQTKARFLKDLSEGTCYGEAVVFMQENPPRQSHIQFLDSDERQQNAIWVQAHQNYDCDLDEQAKRFKKTLRRKYPKLKRKDVRSYERICTHLSKSPKNRGKFDRFMRDIRFQKMLSEKVEHLSRCKNVVKLGECSFDRDKDSRRAFARWVVKDYKKLQRKKRFTDIVYGFDFTDREGAGDHAILVQHTHLRIYDAAHGIYQYRSLKSLLLDLGRRIRNLKKNTYVDYEYFTH